MPALVMRKALFIHVPKTGGNFVHHALDELGIRARPPQVIRRREFNDHPMLSDIQHYRWLPRKRFTFGFVRYPPDWWRSYWAYRMRTGWVPAMDAQIQSKDFATFIENVLELVPGSASKLLEEYVGPPGKIDFVGRSETLLDDFARALALAGYEVDRVKLEQVRRQNTSNYALHPAEYPPELLERVIAAERVGIERWYPERLSRG